MDTRIVRWNPFREMAAMQRAMDRIFDETWRNYEEFEGARSLALDVHENDDNYIVQTAVPGINPDDLDITLHDGVLTISGEFQRQDTDENTRTVISERVYGRFSRSIRLPQIVDSDNVEAAYNDGLLTLTLPKLPDAKPRQIRVNRPLLTENSN